MPSGGRMSGGSKSFNSVGRCTDCERKRHVATLPNGERLCVECAGGKKRPRTVRSKQPPKKMQRRDPLHRQKMMDVYDRDTGHLVVSISHEMWDDVFLPRICPPPPAIATGEGKQ